MKSRETGNIGQRIITIQRNWQHRVENNDNPEKLATQGTQDEDKQNKNNPEKLATQGTQDEDKENKNNPEKLATQGTQDEDKENKNNPEKLATQGTQDEDKQNKNAICVGHHYAQIPLHEGKTNTRLLFGP